MKAVTEERRSDCPVACSLDVLGDKWTLLVIRDLLRGKKRFNDLLASPEAIPTNILTERLKRLESAALVTKTPYQVKPTRYDYVLTPAGEALKPVLVAVALWGNEQFPNTWTSWRTRL